MSAFTAHSQSKPTKTQSFFRSLTSPSYVKSLPPEDLPTFWSPSELQLLIGTTLAPAISAKLKALRREYDSLCSAAVNTRWYGVVQDHLDFDDWLQVDSMYRSRALDFPQIGHCMCPCVDLANHAAGEDTVAIYEKDENGDAVLLLRDGKVVPEDGEVTITYGDEKGACEMLFSYGFLDDKMESAETLFLSLTFADDDPAAKAKMEVADCAPGFKLVDAGDGEVDWAGDFVWILCVNFEDGLRFELARTTEGEEEAQAFFIDEELTGGTAQLRGLLAKSGQWDLYRLRAIAILQQRVFDQLQVLFRTQDDLEALPHGQGTEIRVGPYANAMELRRLEFDLLNRAYEFFEKEVSRASPIFVLSPHFLGIRWPAGTLKGEAIPLGGCRYGSSAPSNSSLRCGLDPQPTPHTHVPGHLHNSLPTREHSSNVLEVTLTCTRFPLAENHPRRLTRSHPIPCGRERRNPGR